MSAWRNIVLVAALLLPVGAQATSATTQNVPDRVSPFMRIYGHAPAPHGFVRFCEARPQECVSSGKADQRINATPERLAELDRVNRAVNTEIEPATDLEIYGVDEYWTLPVTRGDCEDYALLKRHRLMKLGWPASALLMTVVKDEKGEGHAILTARTLQGDFILDNKIDAVRPWSRTPYEFVMRQSYIDPRVWVFLDPREGGTPLPLAGVRGGR